MNRPTLLAVSHLLALAAGWLAFRGEPPAGEGGESPAAARAERRAADDEGRRLLGEMRREWDTEREAAMLRETNPQSHEDHMRDMRRNQAEELEEIRRRSLAVTLPADPAAELARLAAGPEIRDAVAFAIAWLREDPVAALRYLESSEVLSRNSNMTRALNIWVAEADADAAIDLLDEAPGWQAKLAVAVLQTSAAEDMESVGGLLERLEGKVDRQRLIADTFSETPEERRGAALAWIRGNLNGGEAAHAIIHIAMGMLDNTAARAFLKEATQGADEDLLNGLRGWGNYRDIMSSGSPDSSMEERIEGVLAGGVNGRTDDERRNNARTSIIVDDVDKWIGENSLNDAMRFGIMDAEKLWEEAKRNFPHYGEEHADALLKAVFSNSANRDPAGALALLERQGLGDQAGAFTIEALDRMIYGNPEGAMGLTTLLPEETMRELLKNFDRMFERHVGRLAGDKGSYWTGWVGRQPAGLGRDLMLHHSARHYYNTGRENQGDALQAMIRDPEVKARPLR